MYCVQKTDYNLSLFWNSTLSRPSITRKLACFSKSGSKWFGLIWFHRYDLNSLPGTVVYLTISLLLTGNGRSSRRLRVCYGRLTRTILPGIWAADWCARRVRLVAFLVNYQAVQVPNEGPRSFFEWRSGLTSQRTFLEQLVQLISAEVCGLRYKLIALQKRLLPRDGFIY